jgi:hypothetical protein
MAKTTVTAVTRFLRDGYAVATWTNPYDGVSAVTVDPDGLVRSALPIAPGYHRFGLAFEISGRESNLLYPYPGNGLCAHGLVKRERAGHWQPHTSCDCGIEPIGPNPPRTDES